MKDCCCISIQLHPTSVVMELLISKLQMAECVGFLHFDSSVQPIHCCLIQQLNVHQLEQWQLHGDSYHSCHCTSKSTQGVSRENIARDWGREVVIHQYSFPLASPNPLPWIHHELHQPKSWKMSKITYYGTNAPLSKGTNAPFTEEVWVTSSPHPPCCNECLVTLSCSICKNIFCTFKEMGNDTYKGEDPN